jgi:hypothetical protein
LASYNVTSGMYHALPSPSWRCTAKRRPSTLTSSGGAIHRSTGAVVSTSTLHRPGPQGAHNQTKLRLFRGVRRRSITSSSGSKGACGSVTLRRNSKAARGVAVENANQGERKNPRGELAYVTVSFKKRLRVPSIQKAFEGARGGWQGTWGTGRWVVGVGPCRCRASHDVGGDRGGRRGGARCFNTPERVDGWMVRARTSIGARRYKFGRLEFG